MHELIRSKNAVPRLISQNDFFFAYISFIIDCLSNIIRTTWVALNLVAIKDKV